MLIMFPYVHSWEQSMGRKAFRVSDIDEAAARFRTLKPSRDQSEFSCMSLVRKLFRDIETAIGNGCSIADITSMLSEISGMELKQSTVQSSVSKVRKAICAPPLPAKAVPATVRTPRPVQAPERTAPARPVQPSPVTARPAPPPAPSSTRVPDAIRPDISTIKKSGFFEDDENYD